MQMELENLLAIGGVLIAAVASFFSFKDHLRDRFDEVHQKLNDQNTERIRLEDRVNALESIFKVLPGGVFPKLTNEQVEINQQKKKEV